MEQTTAKKLDGHSKDTITSINNLVAYLVGWGESVLKWNRQIDANLPIDFPETGFKWNELGQLAQKIHKDYEEDDYDMLLFRLENTVASILYLIESKPNQELYELCGTENGLWAE